MEVKYYSHNCTVNYYFETVIWNVQWHVFTVLICLAIIFQNLKYLGPFSQFMLISYSEIFVLVFRYVKHCFASFFRIVNNERRDYFSKSEMKKVFHVRDHFFPAVFSRLFWRLFCEINKYISYDKPLFGMES